MASLPGMGRDAAGSSISMATGDANDTHQGHDGAAARAAVGEEGTLEARFAHAPPLALLTTVAAVLHVLLKRVVLPLWMGQGDATPPLWLITLPNLTLNIAATGAVVCLFWALIQIAVADDFSHAGRRTLISLTGTGVGMVAIAALLLPVGRVSVRTVAMCAAATHLLTVQLAMAALRRHPSLAGRTTAAVAAAASLFPLASMVLRHLLPLGPSLLTKDGVAALHGLGELAFLITPIAAAFVVAPWTDTTSGGRARAAGAVATFTMGLLFAGAAQLPAEEYGHILYSTLRLEWALEADSLGYAVPISLAAGGATAALLSDDGRHRQGGIALWLWLAAGYNPLSPARLLLWSLSAALLCRALVSLRQERLGTGATEAV